MTLISALRRLWRHAAFRRLLTLRILSQAADGTLQVGMASYLLFSPQSQPDAWAIAGVLALTLLPFTVIGPFVSPLLDRWSRRNVALYSDIVRSLIALVLGVTIFSGATTGVWAIVLYGGLLVAMSINRFMLAGLSAGLQHTVDEDEYLTASSIVPTVGPMGVVIGAVLGFLARFAFGGVLPSHQADSVVFLFAAVLFAGSVLICRGFAPDALGPDRGRTPGPLTSTRRRLRSRDGSARRDTVAVDSVDAPGSRNDAAAVLPRSLSRASARSAGPVSKGPAAVLKGLSDAWRHLRTRPVAAVALSLMAVTRLLFGLLSVAVILAARNLWHPVDQPAPALADITLWGLFTGVGFILAAPLVPVLVRPLGIGRTAPALLVAGAVVTAAAAFLPAKWPLFVLSFLTGLAVQSFKICVDTIVQAHVDEGYKGRVFTFYDMAFNGAFVLAGVVAAYVLPPTGLSMVAFLGMAATYAVGAVAFLIARGRLGAATFERGTEDLTATAG